MKSDLEKTVVPFRFVEKFPRKKRRENGNEKEVKMSSDHSESSYLRGKMGGSSSHEQWKFWRRDYHMARSSHEFVLVCQELTWIRTSSRTPNHIIRIRVHSPVRCHWSFRMLCLGFHNNSIIFFFQKLFWVSFFVLWTCFSLFFSPFYLIFTDVSFFPRNRESRQLLHWRFFIICWRNSRSKFYTQFFMIFPLFLTLSASIPVVFPQMFCKSSFFF